MGGGGRWEDSNRPGAERPPHRLQSSVRGSCVEHMTLIARHVDALRILLALDDVVCIIGYTDESGLQVICPEPVQNEVRELLRHVDWSEPWA